MPKSHLKSIIRKQHAVVDGQHDARLARKRMHADGMPLTAHELLRMHTNITPPIQKNSVSLDGDGKMQTPRNERKASENAMPKNDQQFPGK